jgi:hypothetical protein
MTYFCQYKDIFGKSNEGVHSYRMFNIAIVDLIFTVIGALVIAYLFKINFIIVFIVLMIFALFMHYLFCVDTTLTKIVLNK